MARALELVAENAGLSGSGVAAGARPVTAEDAWQAVANYSATASWTEIAASAARALGLQPYLCEDSLGFDPGELPALARVGEGQWLVVIGRRGRRLTVVQLDERGERRVRLTPTQLRALVGRQPWLLMRPLLALDPIGVARRPVLKDRTWLRLRAFLGLERRELWVVVIYAIVLGGLTLATPIAAQALVNTVAFGAVLQPLVVLTILLLAGLGFAGALGVLEGYVVEVVQRRVFVRIADDFGRRLPSVRGDALDGRYGPELVNRFFDVFTAQKAVASLLLQGVEALLTAVFGLMVLALYHPILLGFGLAIVAGAAVVFVLLGKGATKTTIAESKAKYEVAGYLEEMARHLFALKLAGGGEHAMRHLDGLAAGWLSRRASHFRIVFRQILGALALQVIASATLLGLGGWLVVERELTIGQLVAAELIVTAVVASLSKLGGKLETVYDLVAASDKLGHLLHLPVERSGGELPRSSEGALRVEVQGLSSDGGEVSDFDLTVDPGEVVAVTGDPTASSALVELLFGLREPTTGSVRIDGYDLRDVDLARIRRRVAVVREAEVWPATIAENLRAVATNVPVAAMWKALDAMGLGAFVRRLPLALHTPLVPSGSPLPRLGGMRLSLARALVADPGVLVLDGALDALPPGEGAVLLERLAKGRTVIVVTTDPDLAARASRRIVLRAEVRS
ncbi:MAG: ATP-binding cassette domain-containing protein [Myxococcales bacterium]|nr:ATP-binding cassette domain-containing protein [Myxococcales bacterium]